MNCGGIDTCTGWDDEVLEYGDMSRTPLTPVNFSIGKDIVKITLCSDNGSLFNGFMFEETDGNDLYVGYR